MTFHSELPIALVTGIAMLLSVAVAVFYFRETRRLAMPHRVLLPLLRATAVALVLMMLCGPVLQWRRESGEVLRVSVFVDASDSMLATDAEGGVYDITDSANPAAESASDRPTRLDLAGGLLLGSQAFNGQNMGGWLERAAQLHRVEVLVLADDRVEAIIDTSSPEPLPPRLALPTNWQGRRTNLADPIENRLGLETTQTDLAGPAGEAAPSPSIAATRESRQRPNRCVVLMSDGLHNLGGSPRELAQKLGDMGVPIHVIGMGGQHEPRDVAVLDMEAPVQVASTGRATGVITVKDRIGEGVPLTLRITSGDQTVWRQTLTSQDSMSRRVPFDFPVAGLVDQLRRGEGTLVERSRITLPLRASVDPVEGEFDLANNSIDFRVGAAIRQRKMLIVDARSRWETRYLRNVFDRDPTWDVVTVIRWPGDGELDATRSDHGQFPTDAKSLLSYDVVIWGDVGPEVVTGEQLGWIEEYVAQGGALVWIDGQRDALTGFRGTVIEPLLPVKRLTQTFQGGIGPVVPTAIVSERAAFRLSSSAVIEGEDRTSDPSAVWKELPPPNSIRQVAALPGAEVWLAASVADQATPAPVMVARLYGGGQVVYLATDETWRWRFRVADLHHARFWNQVVESIMQPPFEVQDDYVALSTGAAQYREGAEAAVRVRLRDAAGSPVSDGVVEATLREASGNALVVPLRLVDGDRGIYQGQTDPLEAGRYAISVRAAGFGASTSVSSEILVTPTRSRESDRIARDESLLRSIAAASGGVYADYQEADRVWDAISASGDGAIIERRIPLAQTFPWFAAVLGLLTIEWWLRKRTGLI